MIQTIEQYFNKLINFPLRDLGRTTNLLWISFGRTIPLNRKNRVELVGEYSLNIQCTWRITKDCKIILAARDFYIPSSKLNEEEIEKFDWINSKETRFDEQINYILDTMKTKIIKSVVADEIGGLKITFSENYVLEIFPDESTSNEFWRIFKPGNIDSHLVITGEGIEED